MEPADEGGEAPCWAHLLDQTPDPIDDGTLAKLLRDLADAVVICDPQGVIVFWNEAAVALFGWPAGDVTGRSLDIIIPARLRNRHWEGYRRVMETGRTDYGGRTLEVPALHRDGHTISIAFTVTLLTRFGEQKPSGIAAVIRDDTQRWQERRNTQQRLDALSAQGKGDASPPASLSAHGRVSSP